MNRELERLRWLCEFIVTIKHRKSTRNMDADSQSSTKASKKYEVDDRESDEDTPAEEEEELDCFGDKLATTNSQSTKDSILDQQESDSGSSVHEDKVNDSITVAESVSRKYKTKNTLKKNIQVESTPADKDNVKKRSWSKGNHPKSEEQVERDLYMETMKSIVTAITDADKENTTSTKTDEENTKTDKENTTSTKTDAETHFCLSLVPNLKRLDPIYQMHAQMQILKVFCDIEMQMKFNTTNRIQHPTQYQHSRAMSTFPQPTHIPNQSINNQQCEQFQNQAFQQVSEQSISNKNNDPLVFPNIETQL